MYVVLFDGVCNLCNASVNWIIDHDKQDKFRFASLQSDYGKGIVEKYGLSGIYMNTLILVDGDKIYTRSTGALRMLKHIGGIYSLGYAFIAVPPFIRNFVYDLVSRNRYKWFGKRETCRIPTPELRQKFIA